MVVAFRLVAIDGQAELGVSEIGRQKERPDPLPSGASRVQTWGVGEVLSSF